MNMGMGMCMCMDMGFTVCSKFVYGDQVMVGLHAVGVIVFCYLLYCMQTPSLRVYRSGYRDGHTIPLP
ncbi:hypothetical protein EON63_11545 [archaeon]|nr:MAG: hypothetical protein EON63_11545 [archaeon]